MAVERVLGTENDPDIIERGSEVEVVPEKTRQEELDEAIQVVVSGDDIFTQEELDEEPEMVDEDFYANPCRS